MRRKVYREAPGQERSSSTGAENALNGTEVRDRRRLHVLADTTDGEGDVGASDSQVDELANKSTIHARIRQKWIRGGWRAEHSDPWEYQPACNPEIPIPFLLTSLRAPYRGVGSVRLVICLAS